MIPIHINLTSARVTHYNDVIANMIRLEVMRCQEQEKFTPTPEQIKFYEKELIRHMTIRKNVEFAQKIKIKKSNLLIESGYSL